MNDERWARRPFCYMKLKGMRHNSPNGITAADENSASLPA